MILSDHKNFILDWNNEFPLDRWYRKKYNIGFNSSQHRAISYIDIYYEWLEDKIIENYIEIAGKENERIANYKKTGSWLRTIEEDVDNSVFVEKFDNLDISAFNEPEIDTNEISE